MGMYIRVNITEPCLTPKDDWQPIFSLFSFPLLIFFLCFNRLLKDDKYKST